MKTNRKRGGGFLKTFCAVVAALIFVFVILPAGCGVGMAGCTAKVIKDEADRQNREQPATTTPPPTPTEPKKRH